MLEMGSSKPWPEAMKALTGQEKMDASAFREYFKPLEDWLISENQKLNETVGWSTGELKQNKLVITERNFCFNIIFFRGNALQVRGSTYNDHDNDDHHYDAFTDH